MTDYPNPFDNTPATPVAPAPVDYAAISQPPAPKPEPAPRPAVATEGGKITVTLKGGTAFDSPWIVIHAADAADAFAQLDDQGFKNLTEKVSAVGAYFANLRGPAPAPARAAAPAAPQGQPAGATQAPTGEARQCQHGEMKFKSGFGKATGKPWSGFFCPSPQGTPDQCSPQFVR